MAPKPSPILKFGGIWYGANHLARDKTALSIATRNMVTVERDQLETRSGLKRQQKTGLMSKLWNHDGALFAADDASGGLRRFAGAPFTTTPTGVGTVLPVSGEHVQVASAGKRLFVTGVDGLFALDGDNVAVREAGGHRSDGYGALIAGSLLSPGQQVAYRTIVGRRTADGVQIIGPPSGRIIVSSPAATPGTRDVLFRVILEPGLNDACFVQVYRSAVVLNGIEPDDDMRLVYERAITTLEAGQKYLEFNDVTPDALRGEYIYTAPNAGEGIQGANEPPPLCENVVLHKQRLWVARATARSEFEFQLIAVGGADGIANNDRLVITGGPAPVVLGAGAEFSVTTTGSASENIAATARAIVWAINQGLGGNVSFWAEYASGPDEVPGRIRIFSLRAYGPAFAVWVDQATGAAAWSHRKCYAPRLPPLLPGNAGTLSFSIQRVAGIVTATLSAGNLTNGLEVGDSVAIFGAPPAGFTGGPFTVTAVGANTFQYADAGANLGPIAGVIFNFSEAEPSNASTAEGGRNRVFHSKMSEFEAFPSANWIDLGAEDRKIIGWKSTRETLFVFKEDGLFRITGDDEDTFDVECMDPTIVALGPDLIVNFNESVVAWTNKGVLMITENSLEVLSEPVDPLLTLLKDAYLTAGDDLEGLLPSAFLVADDKHGRVRLHLPGASQNEAGTASGAGEALEYHFGAKAWTRLDWPVPGGAPRSLTFGVVCPVDGLIYYCDSYRAGAGEGFLWQEPARFTATGWLYDDDYTLPNAVHRAIKNRLVFSYLVDDAPALDKLFVELAVFLRAEVPRANATGGIVSFTAGFSVDNDNDEATIITDSPFGIFPNGVADAPTATYSIVGDAPSTRIAIPNDFSRGRWLNVTLEHEAKDEFFAILGFSMLCEVLTPFDSVK